MKRKETETETNRRLAHDKECAYHISSEKQKEVSWRRLVDDEVSIWI